MPQDFIGSCCFHDPVPIREVIALFLGVGALAAGGSWLRQSRVLLVEFLGVVFLVTAGLLCLSFTFSSWRLGLLPTKVSMQALAEVPTAGILFGLNSLVVLMALIPGRVLRWFRRGIEEPPA